MINHLDASGQANGVDYRIGHSKRIPFLSRCKSICNIDGIFAISG